MNEAIKKSVPSSAPWQQNYTVLYREFDGRELEVNVKVTQRDSDPFPYYAVNLEVFGYGKDMPTVKQAILDLLGGRDLIKHSVYTDPVNEPEAAQAPVQETTYIDCTPTWNAIGALVWRLAVSKEVKALQAMKSEVIKAFAMATALNEILPTLPEDQAMAIIRKIEADTKSFTG